MLISNISLNTMNMQHFTKHAYYQYSFQQDKILYSTKIWMYWNLQNAIKLLNPHAHYVMALAYANTYTLLSIPFTVGPLFFDHLFYHPSWSPLGCCYMLFEFYPSLLHIIHEVTQSIWKWSIIIQCVRPCSIVSC